MFDRGQLSSLVKKLSISATKMLDVFGEGRAQYRSVCGSVL